MSFIDFFIEVLLNSFGLWLIRQLYDNDQAPAGHRRPHRSWFSNILFPSSISFFVFKKFFRQQQRPWMDTLYKCKDHHWRLISLGLKQIIAFIKILVVYTEMIYFNLRLVLKTNADIFERIPSSASRTDSDGGRLKFVKKERLS